MGEYARGDVPTNIVEARSRNKDLKSRVDFQICDVENLIFQDESFDAVVCIETLMHVPDTSKAVAELHALSDRVVWFF